MFLSGRRVRSIDRKKRNKIRSSYNPRLSRSNLIFTRRIGSSAKTLPYVFSMNTSTTRIPSNERLPRNSKLSIVRHRKKTHVCIVSIVQSKNIDSALSGTRARDNTSGAWSRSVLIKNRIQKSTLYFCVEFVRRFLDFPDGLSRGPFFFPPPYIAVTMKRFQYLLWFAHEHVPFRLHVRPPLYTWKFKKVLFKL